ncbi:hypothetical protein [Pajaroellobacter abortibovis]|uniref:hypothetical protein n=1 Tax=Pajaroellobacter abortibovis TaxID=1882918 RepID=UPI0012EC4316|nr:hypothetical protein [Pajaroellobacter abortibovis]
MENPTSPPPADPIGNSREYIYGQMITWTSYSTTPLFPLRCDSFFESIERAS